MPTPASVRVERELPKVSRAAEVLDFLQHVGWQDGLRAELLAERERYVKDLVSTVLGEPPGYRVPGARDAQPMTAEALAGRIYGIDQIIARIESTTREGDRAYNKLQRAGVIPDAGA